MTHGEKVLRFLEARKVAMDVAQILKIYRDADDRAAIVAEALRLLDENAEAMEAAIAAARASAKETTR